MKTNTIQVHGVTPQELMQEVAKEVSREISKQFEEIKKFIPQPDELLSRERTAKRLDINLSTLWSWTKQNKLKAYSLGNRVYYKSSEVDSALLPINERRAGK